jgi:putative Holliday junction resolvase
MSSFERGVRLGVDVGQVRIGVALSDPDGILATPLATVPRAPTTATAKAATATATATTMAAGDETVPSDIVQIARLVKEYGAVEVIVGMPVTLAGRHGPAAAATSEYARLLATAIDPVPVRLADERMSTVVASRRLSERGVRGRRQRAVVDQAAAVEILQSWLDAQRRRT